MQGKHKPLILACAASGPRSTSIRSAAVRSAALAAPFCGCPQSCCVRTHIHTFIRTCRKTDRQTDRYHAVTQRQDNSTHRYPSMYSSTVFFGPTPLRSTSEHTKTVSAHTCTWNQDVPKRANQMSEITIMACSRSFCLSRSKRVHVPVITIS